MADANLRLMHGSGEDAGHIPAAEPSVNDIPDNVLLQRVLRHLATRGSRREKGPLWSVVADHFALGSGYSGQLCRRFGLDPDQIVRK